MERLDELLVLTTILDAGSLAGAARRLRRSPPAVTRLLAALEQRVGARLVQRTTRQLTPTQAGRRLAAHARQLLADYQQAVGRVKESKEAPLHGLLRITAPSMFGRLHIAPVISEFLNAHPGVRVELVLANRNLDLVEEGLDVAVRIGPLTEFRIGRAPDRAGLPRAIGKSRLHCQARTPAHAERSDEARYRVRQPAAFVRRMALSCLWTAANRAFDAEVHGHGSRRSAFCRESRGRHRPKPFLSGSRRLFFGNPGATIARV